MYDQSHICPEHIKDMIAELQNQEFSDFVLSKYHCKTITDSKLSQIYSSLNYPYFSQIPSKTLLTLIHNEYMQDFPSLESENDYFSYNFAQAYHDSQICLISEPLDLNFSSNDLVEVASLNSLWSECTNATPNKPAPAPKTTIRSKNGLKVLSWKVREIVKKLGNSTYQEIADYLVKETEESEVDVKDEKNIRRRVYDALNVLIAVGVLYKDNKKVQIVKKEPNPVIEKVKKLKELTEKYQTLKGIINRNFNQTRPEKALFLPFSLITVGKKDGKSVNVSIGLRDKGASFKVNQEFSMQSSDEVLKKLVVSTSSDWIPSALSNLFKLDYLVNSLTY